MSAQPESKRSIKNFVGEKLYAIMFSPGWPRWALLIAAALVFILVALQLCGGKSYREDPSALVPRSSQVYLETQDLDSLLRTVAAWKLWRPDRRAKGDEQRNQLQVDLAGLIGEQVAGLGTRLPLLWLVDAKQAAYCANRDDEGQESWALFLRTGNSSEIMADIGVESGMNIETIKGNAQQGVFKLTGTGAGELFFAVLDPWLIISSQATLPEFALESSRRPAFSLSRAELLPNWHRGVVIRGLINPVYHAEQGGTSAYGILTKWMDTDTRISFTSKIGRKGLETLMDADQLSERVRGSGLWPLFSILLVIVGLLALLVVFATILAMVGWGGWMKVAAMRAGISPAKTPAPVAPSQAFVEDSGSKPVVPVATSEEAENNAVEKQVAALASKDETLPAEDQAVPAKASIEPEVSESLPEAQSEAQGSAETIAAAGNSEIAAEQVSALSEGNAMTNEGDHKTESDESGKNALEGDDKEVKPEE